MKLTDMRILIVTDDAQLTASLARDVVCGLGADVTVVNSVEEAKAVEVPDGFDAILAGASLAQGDALKLQKAHGGPFDVPIILLDDVLDANRVLEALRSGAADVIAQPINRQQLVTSIRRVATAQRRRRQAAARSRRLRRISSKLVRDRRELRQRVDLICRDLVSAYQRLAHKVVSSRGADLAAEDQSHESFAD